MKPKNMSNITAEVQHIGSRYQGRRTDTIWVHWNDPEGNRYHFWLHPTYDGKAVRASNLDVVDKDILYVNPPEGISPQPFSTKRLKASAKCNAPLIARAFAEINIEQAYRDFDKKEQDERDQLECDRVALRKKQRLEAAAPALLAAVKMLLDYVPEKCHMQARGLVPRKNDPQNLAIEIAKGAIFQAEGPQE